LFFGIKGFAKKAGVNFAEMSKFLYTFAPLFLKKNSERTNTKTKKMAEKKRILLIAQELEPFTEGGLLAKLTNELAVNASEKNNFDLRVLMPRFGSINERRHRLHEVVRLSGMNIIVDSNDYPLIIKVASLPQSRLQVYFLDNEEFFRRRALFHDEETGEAFDDNIDRMTFFCKGALEIVKKFGWSPHIVHCHGFMSSLIPAYLKMAYKTEPLFQGAKIIYSQYEGIGKFPISDSFFAKASINNLVAKDLAAFKDGDMINLHKGALHFSDGLVNVTSEEIVVPENKKLLRHPQDEEALYIGDYMDFYRSFVS